MHTETYAPRFQVSLLCGTLERTLLSQVEVAVALQNE